MALTGPYIINYQTIFSDKYSAELYLSCSPDCETCREEYVYCTYVALLENPW